MGHNCGTCVDKDNPNCAGWELHGVHQRNDHHPSDLHPCAHGEPVVASAVAAVEFEGTGDDQTPMATHRHKLHGYTWIKYEAEWEYANDDKRWNHPKFCDNCGLLLPTASQLAIMYARHKAEQEGR